jgi:membrane fusion protein, multidrug efflux system
MLRWFGAGLVGVAGLLSSGCGGEARANVEEAEPALDVDIQKAKAEPAPKTVRLTGSLRGEVESDLAANASGRVTKVNFQVGSAVKKGDILATIDTSLAQLVASEAGAQAELAKLRETSAKRECERGKMLSEAGAISKSELDRLLDACKTSSVDVAAASARASQASKTIVDGTVRSTIDGVVVERSVEPGEYVRSDSKVARVATASSLRLAIDVPEMYVASAQQGASLTLKVAAFPQRSWSARIDRPGVAVRAASRDVLAEAPIDNADGALLPGMFATVELVTGEETLATVPQKAVFQRDGKPRVFVVANGKANERVVVLGPENKEKGFVAIRQGLSPDEEVVVAPPEGLANGRAVE